MNLPQPGHHDDGDGHHDGDGDDDCDHDAIIDDGDDDDDDDKHSFYAFSRESLNLLKILLPP